MEDVKDKMKGLFKKTNKPFKGQSHILGSSSSTPSNSSSSRLIPPPLPQTTIPKSDSRAADCIKIFLSSRPAESSVETMIKLLKNVLQEPGNDKFRKIRMGNERIKAAVGDAVGGVEVLECAGFRVEEEEGERWARMGEVTREGREGIRDLILGLERWKEGKKDEKAGGDGVVERLDGGEEEMMVDRKVGHFSPCNVKVVGNVILGLERWKGKDDKVVGDGVVENFDGGEEEEMIDRKVLKGKDDKVVDNGVV